MLDLHPLLRRDRGYDGASMQKKTGPSADDWVMDGQVPIIVLAVVIGIID